MHKQIYCGYFIYPTRDAQDNGQNQRIIKRKKTKQIFISVEKKNMSNVFEFFPSRYLVINDISQKEEEEQVMNNKSRERFLLLDEKAKKKETHQSMSVIVTLRDNDIEKNAKFISGIR